MLTTMQRLAKARELALVGIFVEQAPDIRKQVLLKRRAEGLRALLLGRRENTAADLDLFDRDGSTAIIAAHLDSLNDEPLEVQGRAAAYLAIVAEHIDGTGRASGGPMLGNSNAMPDLLRRLHSLREYARTPGYREATYTRFRDAGVEAHRFKLKAEVLLTVAQDVERQAKESQAVRWAALEAEQARRQVFVQPFKDAFLASANDVDAYRREFMQGHQLAGIDPDEVATRVKAEDRLLQLRTEARVAYQAEHARQFDGLQIEPEPDELRTMRDVAKDALANVGRDFTAAALAASPVSEADAKAWADAQEISASGRAKLRKLGYDPKQVRKDMAEFYRLSGGRLAALKIRASRGKRASAGEIHGPNTSIINLGQSFDKRVLFHEMAHHTEADPVALAAARGFIEARRQGDRLHKLRDLTGNKGYGPREVAFKDSWFSEYIGKDYVSGGQPYATEVFSMGLESFSDPETLARRVAQDADHFALMLGFLKTPPDPLFGSVKKVFQQMADAEAEFEDVGEEVKAASLKRLTAGMSLVQLTPNPAKPYKVEYAKDTDYLGSYKLVDVWQVKDRYLTRWVGNKKVRSAGFVVGKHDGAHGEDDRHWRAPFSEKVVFGDLLEAMALARAWADGDGNPDLATPDAAKQWADRIEAAQAAAQP